MHGDDVDDIVFHKSTPNVDLISEAFMCGVLEGIEHTIRITSECPKTTYILCPGDDFTWTQEQCQIIGKAVHDMTDAPVVVVGSNVRAMNVRELEKLLEDIHDEN